MKKVTEKATLHQEKIKTLEEQLVQLSSEKSQLESNLNNTNAKKMFTESYLQEMAEECSEKTQKILALQEEINSLKITSAFTEFQLSGEKEDLQTQLAQEKEAKERLEKGLKSGAFSSPKQPPFKQQPEDPSGAGGLSNIPVNTPANPIIPSSNTTTFVSGSNVVKKALPIMNFGNEEGTK